MCKCKNSKEVQYYIRHFWKILKTHGHVFYIMYILIGIIVLWTLAIKLSSSLLVIETDIKIAILYSCAQIHNVSLKLWTTVIKYW